MGEWEVPPNSQKFAHPPTTKFLFSPHQKSISPPTPPTK